MVCSSPVKIIRRPRIEPTCATAARHSSLARAASRASRESKLRTDMPSQPADFSSMPSTSSVCSQRRRPGSG